MYYDRLLSGGRKGRCGQGPHPFIKKIGGNHFEKTNEDRNYFNESYVNEMNTTEKLRLEKILGRKISNEAFVTYCTREDYEREQGILQTMWNWLSNEMIDAKYESVLVQNQLQL